MTSPKNPTAVSASATCTTGPKNSLELSRIRRCRRYQTRAPTAWSTVDAQDGPLLVHCLIPRNRGVGLSAYLVKIEVRQTEILINTVSRVPAQRDVDGTAVALTT